MQAFFFSLLSVVIVQTPMIRTVTLQKLPELCGAGTGYDACTIFVAYRLEAVCDGRRASARVTFRPLIYLHDIHRLAHENYHIEDIRRLAAAYVTDIEQKEFDTESQCRSETAIRMETFGATMQGFARESKFLQHEGR